MSEAGPVLEIRTITHKHNGKSRGIVFVEFGNAMDAAKAIDMFDGAEFESRVCDVVPAGPVRPFPSQHHCSNSVCVCMYRNWRLRQTWAIRLLCLLCI